jgi:hypothetical protein
VHRRVCGGAYRRKETNDVSEWEQETPAAPEEGGSEGGETGGDEGGGMGGGQEGGGDSGGGGDDMGGESA